jgi:hypothetical protein
MDLGQAREIVAAVSGDKQAILAAAHDRYMYFCGVYTDRPVDDHIAEDREAFPDLLAYTTDGRPSLSDERCADFMAAVSGLPREWCLAWDEVAFVEEHGEDFVEKQLKRQASERLAVEVEEMTGERDG